MEWQNPYLLLFAIFAIIALFLVGHPVFSPDVADSAALAFDRSVDRDHLDHRRTRRASLDRSQSATSGRLRARPFPESRGNGLTRVYEAFDELRGQFGIGTKIGVVSAGRDGSVLAYPDQPLPTEPDVELMQTDGAATDLASAIMLANAVFPAGVSRHVVLISDGQQTKGSLEQAARAAAVHRCPYSCASNHRRTASGCPGDESSKLPNRASTKAPRSISPRRSKHRSLATARSGSLRTDSKSTAAMSLWKSAKPSGSPFADLRTSATSITIEL